MQIEEYLVYKQSLKSMAIDEVMMEKKSQRAKKNRKNKKRGKELWGGNREAMDVEMGLRKRKHKLLIL